MQPSDNPGEEEKRLTEQNQLKSNALMEKHKAGILVSELNNESDHFKSRMLLRHACELINLSQQYLNQWIDLADRQKNSD